MINKASAWLAADAQGPAFGGEAVEALPPEARRDVAARLMPAIRKRISEGERKVGHFTDAPEVLEFVNSRDLKPLAALGTSCPDHFLRTKIRPLVLPFDPAADNLDAVVASLDERLAAYRADYAAYYARCKRAEFAGDARPERRDLSRPRRRHAVVRQGQGDRAHRGRILRQRDQRHARRLEREPVCRPRRAGGVRHRILAARGGEAPAHAEAQGARRARRADHRRRRRHRAGDRGAALAARAPAWCSPTSTRQSLDEAVADFRKAFGRDAVPSGGRWT